MSTSKYSSSSKNARHSNSNHNDEWQLASQNDNLPWQCSLCTFENNSVDNICEMCHSTRRSTTSISVSLHESAELRTHSEPMVNLRLSEEEIALRKWEHIVRYCKQVI